MPRKSGSIRNTIADRDAVPSTPTRLFAPFSCSRGGQPLSAGDPRLARLVVFVDECAAVCPGLYLRAGTVKVAYRLPPKGRITDLVIDSTGLKVFGEGEWKAHKHGK